MSFCLPKKNPRLPRPLILSVSTLRLSKKQVKQNWRPIHGGVRFRFLPQQQPPPKRLPSPRARLICVNWSLGADSDWDAPRLALGELPPESVYSMGQLEEPLREIQIDDESTTLGIRKESPYNQDNNSHDGKRSKYSGQELPEEIWCHIHSLMTMRDAARAACVSHAFLSSWRCYPNLIFNTKIMGMSRDRGFSCRVDDILKKHLGIGMKTFELDFSRSGKPKAYEYLHGWLQIAVKPGIEKLTLMMTGGEAVSFPCSVLSDENGSSIRYLHLVHCAFRPTDSLGCLRNLTELHLDWVRITGDELGRLLSSCVALEQLKLTRCHEITYVKIPSCLQRLSYLQVLECRKLRMLRNEAPNIYSFHFKGDRVEVSLGESLRLKNLKMICYQFLGYVREELPYRVPNLETLSICSRNELANTAMAFAPSKFLHLKHVGICIIGAYDYFSLVSFLDAAPLLETFDLRVDAFLHSTGELLSENPSQLRRMAGYRHDKLQRVKISRFYAWNSLVELTCHILENSASLECITLDTTDDRYRCCCNVSKEFSDLAKPMDTHKAVLAIRKHIKGKVPSTVQLDVVELCRWCYPVLPFIA